MRRLIPSCLVLWLAIASTAHAAAVSPPGVNISWDKCFSDGGILGRNKDFACDVNTGRERLVLSMELDARAEGVTGINMYVDFVRESDSLPPWWSNSCRPGAAITLESFPPPGSAGCVDWGQGNSLGAIATYSSFGSKTMRLACSVAVPPTGVTLEAGRELFIASLLLGHSRTIGTGACGGCDVPMCISFASAIIYTGAEASHHLDRGANYAGSQFVGWQKGYAVNIQRWCDPLFYTCSTHYNTFDCVLATPTSSRHSAWSQVKALYR